MPDSQEPSAWELQRVFKQQRDDIKEGFASVNARLDKLVTQEMFQAEQRRVDDKLISVMKDVEEERQRREEGDHGQQKAIDKLVGTMKFVIASLALPIALFLATLYANR